VEATEDFGGEHGVAGGFLAKGEDGGAAILFRDDGAGDGGVKIGLVELGDDVPEGEVVGVEGKGG
jgi:hypothetical protein